MKIIDLYNDNELQDKAKNPKGGRKLYKNSVVADLRLNEKERYKLYERFEYSSYVQCKIFVYVPRHRFL